MGAAKGITIRWLVDDFAFATNDDFKVVQREWRLKHTTISQEREGRRKVQMSREGLGLASGW